MLAPHQVSALTDPCEQLSEGKRQILPVLLGSRGLVWLRDVPDPAALLDSALRVQLSTKDSHSREARFI